MEQLKEYSKYKVCNHIYNSFISKTNPPYILNVDTNTFICKKCLN